MRIESRFVERRGRSQQVLLVGLGRSPGRCKRDSCDSGHGCLRVQLGLPALLGRTEQPDDFGARAHTVVREKSSPETARDALRVSSLPGPPDNAGAGVERVGLVGTKHSLLVKPSAATSTKPAAMTIWYGGQDRFVAIAHGRWLAHHTDARAELRPQAGHMSLTISSYGQVLNGLLGLALLRR